MLLLCITKKYSYNICSTSNRIFFFRSSFFTDQNLTESLNFLNDTQRSVQYLVDFLQVGGIDVLFIEIYSFLALEFRGPWPNDWCSNGCKV